jgi:hypothetical protein
MTSSAPRVALIHATPLSFVPVADAFRELWPEARIFNVLDDSLAPDKERGDAPPENMFRRFADLTHYAVSCGADGILFTCSAFGEEIAAAGREQAIPVLKPNEAMIEQGVAHGSRLGVIATFAPTLTTIVAEVDAAARLAGRSITCVSELADGAFAALAAGDVTSHDRLVAAAAERLPAVDAVLLAQFSMARTRDAVSAVRREATVLTSPHAAVEQLRARLTRAVGSGRTIEPSC